MIPAEGDHLHRVVCGIQSEEHVLRGDQYCPLHGTLEARGRDQLRENVAPAIRRRRPFVGLGPVGWQRQIDAEVTVIVDVLRDATVFRYRSGSIAGVWLCAL